MGCYSDDLESSDSGEIMDQINEMDSNAIKLMDNGEMDLASKGVMQHQQPIGRISMKNCDGVRIGPEYKIKAENITIIGNVGRLDAHNIPGFINRKTKRSLETIPEETDSVITDVESIIKQSKNKKVKFHKNITKRTKIILLIIFIVITLSILATILVVLLTGKQNKHPHKPTIAPTLPTKKPPVDFFVRVEEWSKINNTVDLTYQNYTKEFLAIDNVEADYCYDKESCINVLQNLQKSYKYSNKYNLNYNYLIGGDGRVYESRGNDIYSDYKNDYSPKFIKISFIGDFKNRTLTNLQEIALKKLINRLIQRQMLINNYIVVPQCCRNISGEKGPDDKIIEFLEENYLKDHPMKSSCSCINTDDNTGTTTEPSWFPWPL